MENTLTYDLQETSKHIGNTNTSIEETLLLLESSTLLQELIMSTPGFYSRKSLGNMKRCLSRSEKYYENPLARQFYYDMRKLYDGLVDFQKLEPKEG